MQVSHPLRSGGVHGAQKFKFIVIDAMVIYLRVEIVQNVYAYRLMSDLIC